MIYTELTIKAMKLAYDAHHGQLDKSGVPYIFHPFHIAEQMNDEYTVCVALLHDIVEDTEVTIEELEKIFPPEVTEAVHLLTHNKELPYSEYVLNIRRSPLAVKVKLADIEHNSDFSRLTDASPADIERLRKKYEEAKLILTSAG